MFRNRRKKSEDNSQVWMTTFTDLVTLLLTFFILLYSFSVLDVQKFQRFIASFQGVGILDSGTEPLDKDKDFDYQIPEDGRRSLQEVYTAVKEYIEENNLETEISIRYVEDGVALEIKEKILFESGKADLIPEAQKVLRDLSQLFRDLPYLISVEGHTDNRPINNRDFPSNWELSTARAVTVVRYLSENLGLDPKKLCAVGYGEYYPVVPNDSPENMAKNRRVVLVINSRNPDIEKGVDSYGF